MGRVVEVAEAIALRRGLIARPRLLARMEERWEVPILVVRGSAGFGKSSLLQQALAANLVAAQGIDVLVACDPVDCEAMSLAGAVGEALGIDRPLGDEPDLHAIAQVVRAAFAARSPTPVALVLDDVHEVTAGSGGADVLRAIVDALPANGHVVLAGRTDPPVPLARAAARGEVRRVDEADLAFDDRELAAFAREHDLAPEQLPGGSWPALAALDAAAARGGGTASGRDFVWEEVLSGLPTDRIAALAVLSAIGEADQAVLDAAVVAAGSRPVPVELLLGLPLVTARAGRLRAHALWSQPLASVLGERQVAAARAAAAGALLAAGHEDEALAMAADVGDVELARRCVRAATTASRAPVPIGEVQRWSDLLAPWAPEAPELVLLRGIVAKARERDPSVAQRLLLDAAAGFRDAGEIDAELAAYVHVLQVLIWTGDSSAQLDLLVRVTELSERGHPTAQTLAGLGRAFARRWAGDHAGALDELGALDTSSLDRRWAALVECQVADAQMALGRLDEALDTADRAEPHVGTEFAAQVDTVRCYVHWLAGRWDECDRASARLIERTRTAGRRQPFDLALASDAYRRAVRGEQARARELVEEVSDRASAWTAVSSKVAAALATLSIGSGDEEAAARVLRHDVERFPLDRGHWAQRASSVALIYVLLPETRPVWDRAPLAPVFAPGLDLARAIVAARAGDLGPARALTTSVDDAAPFLVGPWSAELAAVRAEAGSATDADVARAGEDHPSWLDGATRHPHQRVALRAAAVRAHLPEPVAHPVELRLLGRPEVQQGGAPPVVLARARVRELAALLALRGEIAREQVLATLWPDLPVNDAANNLRVNLNHLRRALEPDRPAGAPSFLVRSHGDRLSLAPAPSLLVDLHEVDRAAAAARAADARGDLDAVAAEGRAIHGCYRGHLDDQLDLPWAAGAVEALRDHATATMLRAGEVLLAQGRPDEAIVLAERVAELDPWSERALRLLATAQLAAGRRAAARRSADRCTAMLAELGVPAEPATQVLLRTVHGTEG